MAGLHTQVDRRRQGRRGFGGAILALVLLLTLLPAPTAEAIAPPAPGPFPDVDMTHPFSAEIGWMAAADVTGGFADGGYHPGEAVSRQAMAAFMFRLWVLLGGVPGSYPDPGFSDVDATHPFFDQISWMADAGITGGFADGGFHPSAPVTRQAMAAFMERLWELFGETPGVYPDPGFSDVAATHLFFDQISWMFDAGITGGFADGGFHPTDPVTRQAMAAFMWRLFDLLTDATCSTQTQIAVTECTALVAIYRITQGAGWTTSTDWLTTTTPCSWWGITCVAATTHPMTVQKIVLNDNGLTGTIPPQVDALPMIELLDLHNNSLSGPLPSDLFDLAALRSLQLSNNLLTGGLPASIGQLDALEAIGLAGNLLSGPIPPEIVDMDSIYGINLSSNGFTGTLPTNLGSIEGLDWFYVADNDLTGSIPASLGTEQNARWFTFDGNRFQGQIPPSFKNLDSIIGLGFSGNLLSGPIPPELESLPSLDWLNLSGNGCFTAATPGFAAWLTGKDALWDDGCP